MQYTLNHLGNQNFETLVQSLCQKIIGEGVKIYGAGPDGQREATFEGKTNFPSSQEGWSGYFVIQAKYKSPDTKTADVTWLTKCFKDEMAGFQDKQKKGKKIPDNYLFFTNVILTPCEENGLKDKIGALAKSYESLIPHIAILGNDEICRYLDSFREIAISYSSFILSGDILSYLYEKVSSTDKERQNALHRYIAQTFKDDYCSRMEQAGQVTDFIF